MRMVSQSLEKYEGFPSMGWALPHHETLQTGVASCILSIRNSSKVGLRGAGWRLLTHLLKESVGASRCCQVLWRSPRVLLWRAVVDKRVVSRLSSM